MSNLREKLIRIERSIYIYDHTDKLVNELNINIPIDKLLLIVSPNADDPELFDGYKLNIQQLHQLNDFIVGLIDINCNEFSYFLVTGGIYDWSI
jgi:hypothetical protein